MITLVAGFLSVIFALISLVAHFWTKSQGTELQVQNQAVKDQVSANDKQIQTNADQAAQIAAQTKQEEANETNQSILDNLNKPKS